MSAFVNIYIKISLHKLFFVKFFQIRGINFMVTALVFNIFPTLLEVSLVTGILVS